MHRNLKGRPPFSDPLGKSDRRWLADFELPLDGREALDGAMRQLEFVEGELVRVERSIAEIAVDWPELRRLVTIPGVDVTTAATLMAAIGDMLASRRRATWSAISGLHPRVRQSWSSEARHGREKGCGRDTGARVFKAVFAASCAADLQAQRSAL